MPKQAKRFQLDPNQTAQENLWRAAEIAQRYLLKRMRFRVLPDQRRELYDAILLAGVENFILNKVLKHRYNYQYDFFSNVYSSMWGASSHVIKTFLKKVVTPRALSSSLDEPLAESGSTLQNLIKDCGDHRLYYDPQPSYKKKDPSTFNAWSRAQKYKEQYEDYRLECEHYGITPVKLEDFIDSHDTTQDFESYFVDIAYSCGTYAQYQHYRKIREKMMRKGGPMQEGPLPVTHLLGRHRYPKRRRKRK